jgi:hypothetical protein
LPELVLQRYGHQVIELNVHSVKRELRITNYELRIYREVENTLRLLSPGKYVIPNS